MKIRLGLSLKVINSGPGGGVLCGVSLWPAWSLHHKPRLGPVFAIDWPWAG